MQYLWRLTTIHKRFYIKKRLNPEIDGELKNWWKKNLMEAKCLIKDITKTYDFRKFKIKCAFGNDIRSESIDMYIANDEQKHLAKLIKELKNNMRPSYNYNLGKVKEDLVKSIMALLKGKEMVFKVFKRGVFSIPNNSKQIEQSEQSEQSKELNQLSNYILPVLSSNSNI